MTHPGETTAPIQSADLSGIIDRLEKATGPDREIDVQVWLATTPGATRNSLEVKSSKNLWSPYTIDETRDATGRLIVVPAVTASVDAAIALAKRVLPGWRYAFERRANGMALAWVTEENDAPCIPAMHENDAVALCLATLRALKTKGEA